MTEPSARRIAVEILEQEIARARRVLGQCPGAALSADPSTHRARLRRAVERGALPGDTDVDALLSLLTGAVWGHALAFLPLESIDVEGLADLAVGAPPRLQS